MASLTKEDKELIKNAKQLVSPRKVVGGDIKEVGSVLITRKGNVFTGVSLDLYCGIGFCAEHSSISSMISNTSETEIKTIVACSKDKVIPPCGRCRELIQLIDKKNEDCYVIISKEKKVKLKYLLPESWI